MNEPDYGILFRVSTLRIAQAANLMQIGERHVRRLIEQGKLRTSGRGSFKRIESASIQDYLGIENQSDLVSQ